MTSPPVVPDQTPVVPDRLDEFMKFTSNQIQLLASQQAEMQRSISSIAAANKPVTVVETPRFTKDQFFEDPDKVIEAKLEHKLEHHFSKLRDDLTKQLIPLNETSREITVRNQLESYFSYLRSNPTFADVDTYREPLTNLILQHKGQIDQGTLITYYYIAVGLHSKSPSVPANAPPQNKAPDNNKIIPPYIRPNSPVSSQTTNLPALPELTEQQKYVARQQRMTDADFLYHGGQISEDVWKAHTPKTG